MSGRSGRSASAANFVTEAVVLMAGSGARLRQNGLTVAKPLVPVLGRPLISYIFEALARAGVRLIHAVVGFDRETVTARVRTLIPAELDLEFIYNREWKKQNGISLLAAAGRVTAPFLVTMSDHLFDQSIVDLLVRKAVPEWLNLAIDRKLDSVFDLDDATKVQTRGDRIAAIGKELVHYDAIDTGLFVCGHDIFDYLEKAKVDGDCSLSDGVRLMANHGKARGIDIEDGWWQDIDTPMMLASAEQRLRGAHARQDLVTVKPNRSGSNAGND
jgi:1L-myo-inositol 1-phosphate cytidylyltransferase